MNLPERFKIRTLELLKDEFSPFLDALETSSPVSVRVNDKITMEPSAEKVPWCDTGFYLPERPLFTADPLFHAGAYYVQEASSMFLQQALIQYVDLNATVLDLCAAPGGKSTLISQYINDNGLLVSNEIIKSRAYILTENIIKWGNENVLVSNNAPIDFDKLTDFFDAIVVDAPCSGEGMFRKDPGAIDEWSEQNVLMCAARQKEILGDVWNALKPGGILIYSTCTYNPEENEKNIQWIENELDAQFIPLDTHAFPEITVTEKGYRFFPHKTRGEGFFLSVLRKNGEKPVESEKYSKEKGISKEAENLRKWLLNPEKWKIYQDNNLISAFDADRAWQLEILKKNLKLLHFGITLAEQKGKDFVPHTSLAMSKQLNKEYFQISDIKLDTAISYLQREAISLQNAEKGYILLTYRNIPIGWVKNVGNRCNNLYPQEWRIRMRFN